VIDIDGADAILAIVLGAIGEMRWRLHQIEKRLNGK